MMVSMPHLVCALLLTSLLSVGASAPGSSECAPQEIPNMTLDVSNAVAKGARFTDPLKVASIEECVSACCMELNSIGDRSCNLAVFDTRSSNLVQNCYLFVCPDPRSCPMTPSPGVISYSFWTEKQKFNPDSIEEDWMEIPKSKSNGKVQNTSSKKSSPAVQATVSLEPEIEKESSQHDLVEQSSQSDVHSQSKISEMKLLTKEDKADTPDRITSQLLHLANDIDKQLEKIESDSKKAKYSESVKPSVSPTVEIPLVEPMTSSKQKDSKKLSSDTKDTKSSKIKKKPETLEVHYPTPELITSAPSVRTSHPISPAAHHPIQNSKNTVTPSKESKVAKKAPSSATKSIKVLLSHNSANASSTATTVKNMQAGHLLITTQVPTTNTVHQTISVLPVTQRNSSRSSLLKAEKSNLKDGVHAFTSKDMQETDQSVPIMTSQEQQGPSPAVDTKDVARNLDTIPGASDKSGLVAALVFGVMFLLLVIGLVSHKVSEARRRHQYTKLDYLINGMYVDT